MGMGPAGEGASESMRLAPSALRADPPLMSGEARRGIGEEEKKKSAVGQ
jgi:hypothetical protein